MVRSVRSFGFNLGPFGPTRNPGYRDLASLIGDIRSHDDSTASHDNQQTRLLWPCLPLPTRLYSTHLLAFLPPKLQQPSFSTSLSVLVPELVKKVVLFSSFQHPIIYNQAPSLRLSLRRRELAGINQLLSLRSPCGHGGFASIYATQSFSGT